MFDWMPEQVEIATSAREERERRKRLARLTRKNRNPEAFLSVIVNLFVLGVFILYFLPRLVH